MTDKKWKDDGMSSIFWTYTERTGRGVYNYRLIQYYKDDGMSSLFWIYTERTGVECTIIVLFSITGFRYDMRMKRTPWNHDTSI